MATYREGRAIKVILLGDAGVGKTSIIRFINGSTSAGTFPKSGHTNPDQMRESYSVRIPCEGSTIKFEIWDTCGQEKYHTLTASYLRYADVVLLVYDISKDETFKHIHIPWTRNGFELRPWMKQIEMHESHNTVRCIRYLVGNKSDLEDKRQVEKNYGEAVAKEIDAHFTETSAKTGFGINELFVDIAKRFPKAHDQVDLLPPRWEENSAVVNLSDAHTNKKKFRC
jgi:small GTP-binding protein